MKTRRYFDTSTGQSRSRRHAFDLEQFSKDVFQHCPALEEKLHDVLGEFVNGERLSYAVTHAIIGTALMRVLARWVATDTCIRFENPTVTDAIKQFEGYPLADQIRAVFPVILDDYLKQDFAKKKRGPEW